MPERTWKGADSLADSLVPIETLTPLPGNPRQGDVGAISQSLERFGQLKTIVVDGEGIIIAGNHTYLAAHALGWTHIAATTPEHLDGEELAAFALADNRLSDLADYDNDALVALMERVNATTTLDGTGFDLDDLDDLIQLTGGPLDLDDLESEYGDHSEEALWPSITLRVPPAVKSLWDEKIGDSWQTLEQLLVKAK